MAHTSSRSEICSGVAAGIHSNCVLHEGHYGVECQHKRLQSKHSRPYAQFKLARSTQGHQYGDQNDAHNANEDLNVYSQTAFSGIGANLGNETS
ncbi:hypothetical protein CHS0354_004504 [Potamilus streckersoni]|uniref:Uncharacterized protein n=1 Tax=Potamilus streckersoni TaxID=2493646 RepID=A0AAE0VPW4_9BIVA|nr:hypothetical protein CHS0354_004504 [Potamilus streckersoni]